MEQEESKKPESSEKESLDSNKIINKEFLERLGDALLLEALHQELLQKDFIKAPITFKMKKEGNTFVYYLTVPSEWVKRLGFDRLFQEKLEKEKRRGKKGSSVSLKVMALMDFKNKAITVDLDPARAEDE